MNKLVSKNPVQRFKLGNRIEKLQKGRYVQAGTSTFGTKIWVDTQTGHLYKTGLDPNVEKMNLTPQNSLGTSTSVYSGLNGRITINGRDYIRKNNSDNRTQVSTGTNVSKTTGNGLRAVEMNTFQEQAQKANLEKMMAEETARKKASSIRKPAVRKPAAVTKPAVVNKLSVVPKTSFYGQGIGGTVLASGNNFNGLISDDARNKLIATGKFDNNSFSSVQNFQTALNNYFANDGAGSITVDDKWGNQTQKAFDLALAKAGESHGQTFNPNVNQYNNTIETPLSTVSYGYTPTEKIQVTTPQRIYNREDVRDFIRSRGKNAYGFSGAQRRALRMVLNGQGTDTDRAIVSGMGIFKKGGLISKNPIKRFKNLNK